MNDYTTIALYKIKRTTTPILTEAKEFVPTGRFLWFKKILWKFLLNHGCLHDYYDQTETYERIEFNRKDFTNSLLEKYNECKYQARRLTKVYMGPEDFEELADLDYKNKTNFFNFNVTIHQDRTMFNLPIQIIPYMKGILFV